MARRGFRSPSQRCPESLAACAAMHQQLRQIGAVRLILGLFEHQLHGAAHAFCVLGDEQRAMARGHALRDAAPERYRALARQRAHEAHRGTAFDAVDQYARERFDVRVIQYVQTAHGPGGVAIGVHRKLWCDS